MTSVGHSEDWVVLHPDDVTTFLTEDGQEVLGYRVARSLLQPEPSLLTEAEIQREITDDHAWTSGSR